MEVTKKGKYLVVVRKIRSDKNGNPRYILNTFEENENGEYIEILEEMRIKSYNIKGHVEYLLNGLVGVYYGN